MGNFPKENYMTNEEEIRQKVQAATKLLLEIMVLLPPTAPPIPPLQLVWNGDDSTNTCTHVQDSELKKIPRIRRGFAFLSECCHSAANGRGESGGERRSFFRSVRRRFCEIYEKGDFTNANQIQKIISAWRGCGTRL